MRKSYFKEFLVLLGPIISRLFTCSNAEKNKIKKHRVLALVLSLCSRHVFGHRGEGVGEGEARKLTGENLKVAWADILSLSLAVIVTNVTERHDTQSHLQLKTRPRFSPVSLNMSMHLLLPVSVAGFEPLILGIGVESGNTKGGSLYH